LLHKPKTAGSKGIRKFFAVLVTFNFVCFCWIFFRNTTFEASVVMLKQICTAFHPEVFMQLIEGYWKVFVLMGIGYLLHFAPDSWQNACCRGVVKLPLLGKALLLVVLIYLVIQIKSSDIQPFIYFQF
jgi:alginate O-acetyltransferase complex protein AlgI